MKNLVIATVVLAMLAFAAVASAAEIEGVYDLQGTHANGTAIKGTATIVKNEATYTVTFVYASHTNTGVGVILGDQFAVAWARPDKSFGVSVYQIKGKTLAGIWAGSTDKKTGTETLTKR